MSLTAAAIRLMAEKGFTAQDIADVAEAMEKPVPDLSAGALRTRKWREKKATKRHGDVTETRHGDVTTSRARVEDNSPISENPCPAVAVVERERADDWPSGSARDHARQLIEAVASPWLDPNKSLDLNTTHGRLAAWKRDGASWEFDVLPVVQKLACNRRSRIGSWKFFDAAVAQSIADNRAALEIPEAAKIVPFRSTGPPRTIDEKSTAAWDYAMAKIAQDEQP